MNIHNKYAINNKLCYIMLLINRSYSNASSIILASNNKITYIIRIVCINSSYSHKTNDIYAGNNKTAGMLL